MNLGKFNDTEIGSTYNFTVLVLEMNERVSKTDKPFVNFVFTDGVDKIQANFFDKTISSMNLIGVEVGKVVDLTFNVKTYNNKKNFTIENIGLCPDPDATVEKFVQSPPYSTDYMFKSIVDLIKKSTGREYEYENLNVPSADMSPAALTIRLLNKNHDAFCKSSAAHSIHHDIRGGLLYHTFRMVYMAYKTCDVYRTLDRELLVCGTALHDIGKIYELDTDELGSADYSVDGRLFGHAVMGMSMVDKEAERGSYGEEDVRLIKHMIASHHGSLEFGAITTPATPEAFMLHEIDMMDSRMYIFEKELGKVEPGEVTDRVFALENSSLYRSKSE
ncbi:MAG: HD domain-containing protein [Clostridiales bacterium]|nr:HD domain-containing protein [Clostridiales bacterium]